jgi:uncharacterized membrane protein
MLETVTNRLTDTLNGSLFQKPETINVESSERVLSTIAGAFLFYKGITQLIKHPIIGIQEALVGGVLIYRGATGYCPIYAKLGKDSTDVEAVRITETFIVNRPRSEVYSFWRKLENLPKFMKHLALVEQIDEKVSHWKAKIPGDLVTVSWNAEITREEESKYIGWQSVAGSQIDNAGKVEFEDAANGGTQLNVEINYFPPAGNVGRGIAKLFNNVFDSMVSEDILNFKHYVEGEEYQSYSSIKA